MNINIEIFEKYESGTYERKPEMDLQDLAEHYGYADIYPSDSERPTYYYLDKLTDEFKEFSYEQLPCGIGSNYIDVAIKTEEGFVLGTGTFKNH